MRLFHADASAGKAADTAAAPKAAKQAEDKSKAAPVKAPGDRKRDQPQDSDIEAGEVDTKKGNLLRPDAPEFKPGKEDSSASAAAAATSSKRKEAEQASSTQVQTTCDYSCSDEQDVSGNVGREYIFHWANYSTAATLGCYAKGRDTD